MYHLMVNYHGAQYYLGCAINHYVAFQMRQLYNQQYPSLVGRDNDYPLIVTSQLIDIVFMEPEGLHGRVTQANGYEPLLSPGAFCKAYNERHRTVAGTPIK